MSITAMDLDRHRVQPVGVFLKVIYSLAILGTFVITVVLGGGWTGLAVGGQPFDYLIFALVLFCIWRAVEVWRVKTTLSAPVPTTSLKVIRWIGLILMATTVLIDLLLLFQRFLVPVLFGGIRSEDGIEFFIYGIYASLIGGVATKGILLFEASRLIGFEMTAHRTGNTKLTARQESIGLRTTYAILMACWFGVSLWGAMQWINQRDVPNPYPLVLPVVPMLIFYACRFSSVIANREGFVRWLFGPSKWFNVAALVLLSLSIAMALWAMFPRAFSDTHGIVGASAASRATFAYALVFVSAVAIALFPAAALFDFARLYGFENQHRRQLVAD